MQSKAKTYERERGESPWSYPERVRLLFWGISWTILCSWTPKPFWRWRNSILRLYGAKIGRGVFVHQRARIQIPWRITLHDRACIGDRAQLYSLDAIEICEGVTVAQEAYLCTGTHNFEDPDLPLVTLPIKIGPYAFIGARAFVMPGVNVGERALVGACAVVTRNVAPGSICVGNPGREIERRTTSESRRHGTTD